MDLTVWNEKDKLFLKICGEVDHHAVKDTREKVDSLILKNHPKTLIMDLSQIDFMDSSGLGLILGRFNTAKELGAEMKILSPSRGVKKVLELAGIERLIKIEEDYLL